MTCRGSGNLPGLRRVGELKGEAFADLGCWWPELRTVAEGWLGSGVYGIPFMVRSLDFGEQNISLVLEYL